MLIDDIKAQALNARKAGYTTEANLFTTLYSEANMIGINDGHRQPTDVEVLKVVKKFLKNAEEVIKHRPDNQQAYTETQLLKEYLPKQLTEEELRVIILTLVNTGQTNVGQVMNYLKTKYEGLYDGGIASRLTKAILEGN